MMSFQIAVSGNRRAAARFIGSVRRALQEVLVANPDIKRTHIAEEIGVHRSVITRQLSGKKDLSLGRIAEIAWALGYTPSIRFDKNNATDGSNLPATPEPARRITTTSTSTSHTARLTPQKKLEDA